MAKKITAVLGDYYHEQALAVKSLEKAIIKLRVELNLKIEITHLPVTDLVAGLDDHPDIVVLFAENRLNPEDEDIETWMTIEEAIKINEYVANGGSWLGWHSGLASYENIKPYTTMLRGYFLSHPDKHQMVKYKIDPDAAVVEKELEFECLDEHYFVHVEEEQTKIFMRSYSVDGSSIAGWRHEYGEGKVLCLTPAHLEEGLMHQQFLQVLTQSVKWCL